MPTQSAGINIELTAEVQRAVANLRNVNEEFERMGSEAKKALAEAQGAINDLSKGNVSINRLTQALNVFRTAANNTTDSTRLREYNRNIQLLEGEIQRLSNSGRSLENTFNRSRQAMIQAGSAIQNLGRSNQSIASLTQALNTYRQALQTATDPNKITAYNRNIQLLENEISRLSRLGRDANNNLPGAGNSANRAATALTNLGRVASDAPFGFIAIQNNLDPLIQSFTLLSATSGGAQGAFKALGSALLGPAGLALGFATLSSLSTVLIQKYGSLGKAFTAIFLATDNASKAQRAYNEELKTTMQQASQEIAVAQQLYKATQNVNIPLGERNLLIDELQKKYPEYFGSLSREAILAGKAAGAYDNLTKALLATARVKAVEAALAKNAQAAFDVRTEIEEVEKTLAKLRAPSSGFFDSDILAIGKKIEAQQNKLNGLKAKERDLTAQANSIAEKAGDSTLTAAALGVKGFTKVTDVLAFLNVELDKINKKSAVFSDGAKRFGGERVQALTAAFDALGKINTDEARTQMAALAKEIEKAENSTKALKDAAKDTDNAAKVFAQLPISLKAAELQAAQTGQSFDSLAKEKIKILDSAINRLVNLGVDPASTQISNLNTQIVNLRQSMIGTTPIATKLAEKLGNVIKENQKTLTSEELRKLLNVGANSPLLDLKPELTVRPTVQERPALQSLQKFWTKFNVGVKSMSETAKAEFSKNYIAIFGALKTPIELGPAIVNLGDQLRSAVGTVAVGLGESIGNLISGKNGLGDVFKGILGLMGSFIADFGKSLVTAATLRIIAEKQLLSNPYAALAAGIGAIAIGTALKNKVPAFATGGFAMGPQLAVIGDNPGRKEMVVPSEDFDKLGGGGSFTVTTRLSGQDILLVVQRAGRELKRFN